MITVTLSLFPPTGQGNALALQACQLLQTAINDSGFQTAVRNGAYSFTERRFDDDTVRSTTNDEVLEAILTGKEYQRPQDDVIDLEVEVVNLEQGVFARVSLPSRVIRVDLDFFTKCLRANDPVPLAGLLMHEWMHVAGFDHSPIDPSGDVPTMVGELVETHRSISTVIGRRIAAAPSVRTHAEITRSKCDARYEHCRD